MMVMVLVKMMRMVMVLKLSKSWNHSWKRVRSDAPKT